MRWRRRIAAAAPRRAHWNAIRSMPLARAPTRAPVTTALTGQYAAKSESAASTPNAARMGWRRMKEGP